MLKIALPACIAQLDYRCGADMEERLLALRGAGIDAAVVCWPNTTPYCYGWDGRDRYDYRPLDALLTSLLKIQPDVRFLVSFGALHGVPYYWGVDHPEELGLFRMGYEMHAASLGSQRWMKDSSEAARRFAAHFAEGEFAEHILGFVPYSIGVDWHGVGESFVDIPAHETSRRDSHPTEGDFSKPMQMAYREYLTEKYGGDDALQDAWRDPRASLKTAILPDRTEVRSPTPRTRDYFECYSRLNARLAIAWCDALKKGAPNRCVGLGHGFVFGYPHMEALHASGSGHNAPEELLGAESIDFLLSASVGAIDEPCPLSMHAIDSLRLHGKTHVHVIEGKSLCAITEEDQCAGIRRGATYAAVKGSRLSFGEPRLGEGNMRDSADRFNILPYDSDTVRAELKNVISRHAELLEQNAESCADVAVFVSPRGSYTRAMESAFGRERIEPFRRDVLLRSGLVFDEYLLSDFATVADRYVFWVFIDGPDISEGDWEKVKASPGKALFATAGDPITDPRELRTAAKAAGAHVWCDSDDIVFANDRLLVVQALTSGEKTIHLPHEEKLTRLESGDELTETRELKLQMHSSELSVFVRVRP